MRIVNGVDRNLRVTLTRTTLTSDDPSATEREGARTVASCETLSKIVGILYHLPFFSTMNTLGGFWEPLNGNFAENPQCEFRFALIRAF